MVTFLWYSCSYTKQYLLYLFGPFWRVTKSHEYTVGQNRTHNDHAEPCGKRGVKGNFEKGQPETKNTV